MIKSAEESSLISRRIKRIIFDKTRGTRGPRRSPEYIKYSIRRFFKKSVRILHRRESKTEEIRAKYMNDNQYESVPIIQKSILFAR